MLYHDPVKDAQEYHRNMNVLLAPIRALRFVGALFEMFIVVLLFVLLAPIWYGGWVIGVGPYSTWWRHQSLASEVPSSFPRTVVVMDLAHRDTYSRAEGHAAATTSLIGYPGELHTTDLKYSMCEVFGGDLTLDSVPYGSRSREWFIRKGNRLERDLISGAANMAALRYTLTTMKLGLRPKDRFPVVDHDGKVIDDMCHVDPAGLTPAALHRWIRASYALNLDGAPTVEYVLVENMRRWSQMTDYILWGACLKDECEADFTPRDNDGPYGQETPLAPFTGSSYGDLFADLPPISVPQMNMEKALLATGEDTFWLQMAHTNLIFSDDEIRTYAAKQRERLALQLLWMTPVDKSLDRFQDFRAKR